MVSNWEQIESELGLDLEASARQAGALIRKREIRSAVHLLRLGLMYALGDCSLRMLGVWAFTQGLGYLSDVAVLKRLRNMRVWLGQLIGVLLKKRCEALQSQNRIRIRVQDATTLSRPGSSGADWRIHLNLDLWPLCLTGIEISDAHTAESLTHFEPCDHEIRVADSVYATAKSLAAWLAKDVGVVVRIHWHRLALETETGKRLDLIGWLKTLSAPAEQMLWLTTPQGRFPLRLLALPLPPAAAEQARARTRKANSKKVRQLSPKALYAAGFVLLLTNLPESQWPLRQVFWIYRLRWQIEIAIRRLKSLLLIDHLQAKDPDLAQTYLLAKLLAALLVDQLSQVVFQQQPDWFLSLDRPVSIWRLTQACWDWLHHLVGGRFNLVRFFQVLPALKRYFCSPPRARPQQLTWARAYLDFVSQKIPFFSC